MTKSIFNFIIDILGEIEINDNFKFSISSDFELAREQENFIIDAIKNIIAEKNLDSQLFVFSIKQWAAVIGREWNSTFESNYGDIIICEYDSESDSYNRIISIDIKAPLKYRADNKESISYGAINILSLVNMVSTAKRTSCKSMYMCIGSNNSIKIIDSEKLLDFLTSSKNGCIMMCKDLSKRKKLKNNPLVADLNGKVYFYDKNSIDKRRISDINDNLYYVDKHDFVPTLVIKKF